jgi:paraquat-inducible protein B
MSRQGSKTVIGAFVAGAIVLVVLGIVYFGSGALFSDRQLCVMYFDGDLKGLDIGAPVAFRGVRVGQVSDITVFVGADNLTFNIPVEAEIDIRQFHRTGGAFADLGDTAYLKALIDKGLRAQLALQSIVTGRLQIQLDIYPEAPLELKGSGDALEIPTIPSRFELLTKALEDVPFKEVVRNFNQAVSQFGQMLEQKEVQTFFGSIQTAADEVARLARDLDTEAQRMTRSVTRAAETVDQFFKKANREVDPVLADAQAALAAMQQTMVRAEQALASIDDVAEGYSERSAFRYEISQAMTEIAAAARSLRALTDLLQQQPEALIRGKQPLGGEP